MSVAGLTLIVGCGAGVVGKEILVPIAGAQVEGQQFQHQCVDLKWEDISEESELRPDLGSEGWELVSFTSAIQRGTTRIIACFKRQVR